MKNDNNEETTPKKKLRNELIIHSIILIILFVICCWDRIENIPRFPKNFLFLTQICLYSNIIYYSFSTYHNIKEQNEIIKSPKLLKLLNFNFCISFVVFIMYWSMLFLDKATLYKKDSTIKVPTSLNMLLHGGVFTTNLIETFSINKRKNLPYIKIMFYFFFTIFYLGILYISKIFFDIKIYPFIYGNVFKFLFISAASFIVCLIGHYIYIFITKKREVKNDDKNYKEFEMNKVF